MRQLAIVAGRVLLVAAFWSHFPDSWLLRVVCCVVLWIPAFFVATIVHNAMHNGVFTHPVLQTVWEVALSTVFGFATQMYKPTHNHNHHVFTELDQDHLNTDQMKYRLPILNLLLFFPTVFPNVQKLEREYVARESRRLSSAFFLFAAETICCWGLTLTLIWWDWRRGLALWLLPNIAGVDMVLTMNLLQHDGCAKIKLGAHKGAEMDVNCARNFVGPVVNFFTCNNGYHSIHHMYNRMHWSEHPAMHAKLIKPRIDPALCEPCIVRYLWRVYLSPTTNAKHLLPADAGNAGNALLE